MSSEASKFLSEAQELPIRTRDNSCVVCGYTAETDVVHIAARNDASEKQVRKKDQTIDSC